MSIVRNDRPLRQREPRIRDKEHLGKVAKLPCLACLVRGRLRYGVQVAHIRCSFVEVAGWREVGKSEKPSDFRTAPLCVGCHLDGPDAQHKSNEKAWWSALGIYPPDFCQALVDAFAAGETGVIVVRDFARDADPRR